MSNRNWVVHIKNYSTKEKLSFGINDVSNVEETLSIIRKANTLLKTGIPINKIKNLDELEFAILEQWASKKPKWVIWFTSPLIHKH